VRPEDWLRARDRVALLSRVNTLAQRYSDRGIWILTAADADYPEQLNTRLGNAAPVILFGAGNVALLGAQGIGVVGSRDLDDDGVKVTRKLGAAIADAGLTLISGGARGADQISMGAAAEHGGSVVGVLAHPLERQLADRSAQELIADQRLCFATPFKPSAGFSVANAMARNKLVYALAERTIVVASDLDSGGTWAGATEALRRHYGAVSVWSGPGAGPGNGRLADMGATSIADVDSLLTSTPSETGAQQLSFGS
jgi:predicted Rossmann fold nucleotide-binding protein DprA/Smf involved in DNA uptake